MNLSQNFDRARTEAANAYQEAMIQRKWRVRKQKANAIWKNLRQAASDNATIVYLSVAVFVLLLAMTATSIFIAYLWNSVTHQNALLKKPVASLVAPTIQSLQAIELPQTSVMDRSEQIELRFSSTLSQPQPKEK